MTDTATSPAGEAGIPFYRPVGNECEIFEKAYELKLPLLLKGPTGCGKTRFVAHMAARLGLRTDGPLTTAVRHGGVCYLDEVVEARKDVTVVLHPLTDDRRILPLERTGELLEAPDNFMLVISYNPGYQGLDESRARLLVRLARRLRSLKDYDLEEGASTRLVIYCGNLVAAGVDMEQAIETALIEPLSDDEDVKAGLREAVAAIVG